MSLITDRILGLGQKPDSSPPPSSPSLTKGSEISPILSRFEEVTNQLISGAPANIQQIAKMVIPHLMKDIQRMDEATLVTAISTGKHLMDYILTGEQKHAEGTGTEAPSGSGAEVSE